MGYPIYRDVKVWASSELTKGEKLAALVLADDANDRTRLTFSSTEDPEILRQALVPDDRAMRRILVALQKLKIIVHAGGGYNGSTAKYRFLHLDPTGCPGPPECVCPAGKAGENHPSSEPRDGDEGGQKSPAFPDPQDLLGSDQHPPSGGSNEAGVGAIHPGQGCEGGAKKTAFLLDDDIAKAVQNDPPSGAEGGRFSAGRRVKTTRPTPSTSSTTSSSTAAAAKPARSRKPVVEKSTEHQVADDLTVAFWDHHGRGRAQSFISVKKIVRTAIGNGIERDLLARALDQVARTGRPVSGATIDYAIGDLLKRTNGHQRGGARAPHPTHDEIASGSVVPNV
jgi:hypothetical protein